MPRPQFHCRWPNIPFRRPYLYTHHGPNLHVFVQCTSLTGRLTDGHRYRSLKISCRFVSRLDSTLKLNSALIASGTSGLLAAILKIAHPVSLFRASGLAELDCGKTFNLCLAWKTDDKRWWWSWVWGKGGMTVGLSLSCLETKTDMKENFTISILVGAKR